jgi:hypothetical protein
MRRDKILMPLIGLAVFGLAWLTLQGSEGGSGGVAIGSGPLPGLELEQALEEITDGTAEDAAEAVANEIGLVPMAVPCIMRRPRLAPGVDREWRHRYAAAVLMTDPDQSMALLVGLRDTAPDPLSLWRIEIGLVEHALRIGDTGLAAVHLAQAQEISVPPACQADMAWLAASLADKPAEAGAHLDDAVSLDPGLWLAQEDLALLAAAGTGSGSAACEADAVRILNTVVQLGALARQDIQFQRLNRSLDAMPENGRTALLRGMILRQTAQPDAARALYRIGLENLGTTPCDAILARGLAGMLAATEGTQ